ncbi:MAG TPA: hypothetical protein VEY51_17745 [Chondromyces sp.]|nr:hypothetical protein [Chondromyces sp.]
MKKKKISVQEEYGMEFGDINAAKLYEVTAQRPRKREKKKEKEC